MDKYRIEDYNKCHPFVTVVTYIFRWSLTLINLILLPLMVYRIRKELKGECIDMFRIIQYSAASLYFILQASHHLIIIIDTEAYMVESMYLENLNNQVFAVFVIFTQFLWLITSFHISTYTKMMTTDKSHRKLKDKLTKIEKFFLTVGMMYSFFWISICFISIILIIKSDWGPDNIFYGVSKRESEDGVDFWENARHTFNFSEYVYKISCLFFLIFEVLIFLRFWKTMKNRLYHFYRQKFGIYSKLVIWNAIFFSLVIILAIWQLIDKFKEFGLESARNSEHSHSEKILWILYIIAMMIPQYIYFGLNLKNVDFKLFIDLLISGNRLKIPLENSSVFIQKGCKVRNRTMSYSFESDRHSEASSMWNTSEASLIEDDNQDKDNMYAFRKATIGFE
jgi:hypothetical protein